MQNVNETATKVNSKQSLAHKNRNYIYLGICVSIDFHSFGMGYIKTMSQSISISRRQLILGIGSIAVLTSTYATYQQLGSYPSKPKDILYLSDKEYAIYQALGNVLIPEGGKLPGSGGDDVSMKLLDAMFANLPEGKRELLSALPLVFEHGTVIHFMGSARFTDLEREEQNNYIQKWSNSTLLIPAQLLAALKTLYGFSYFERPDVLQAIGMPPFCSICLICRHIDKGIQLKEYRIEK